MSFSAWHKESFDSLLRGHTTTILLEDRETNLKFAKGILWNMALQGHPCSVLDFDALYSSNSTHLLSRLPEAQLQGTELIIPEPGSDLSEGLAALLDSDPSRVLIIDSLNSLYHLLAYAGDGSGNRNLGFVMAVLSRAARVEKRAVLLTMYRRERPVRFGRHRPIAELSDSTVSASLGPGSLRLRKEHGSWPARDVSLPIP